MKKHYYLVHGSIVFTDKENENPVKLDLNAILPTDTPNIDTKALGKAQQNLQLTFHKKMEDPELQSPLIYSLWPQVHLHNWRRRKTVRTCCGACLLFAFG